jgi:hypothetical protein
MEEELYQILLSGGAVGMLWVIYKIICVVLSKKLNGQARDINKIATNDLVHISEALMEQNKILNRHTELLIEISTTLKNKLN